MEYDYAIAVRINVQKVVFIQNELSYGNAIALYESEASARKAASNIPLCKAYGFQIIPIARN